jgi:DNA-binding transcriptional MocR family regulator
MTQSPRFAEVLDIVRQHREEIHVWQEQKRGQREIAARLGISRSSYQRALTELDKEEQLHQEDVHVDTRTPTNAGALAKVYDATPVHRAEGSPAWVGEVYAYLPSLRELQDILPALKTMAREWSKQESLTRIPEQYQKFNETYSVRLSGPLIEAIKAYAQRHRLTQSELITAGVLRILNNDE